MLIGNAIKQARVSAKMGQAELAAALDVSIPTVSEWENNRKRPAPHRWDDIANTLRVSRESLFNRTNLSESIEFSVEQAGRSIPKKKGRFFKSAEELSEEIDISLRKWDLGGDIVREQQNYIKMLLDILSKDENYNQTLPYVMTYRLTKIVDAVIGEDGSLVVFPRTGPK